MSTDTNTNDVDAIFDLAADANADTSATPANDDTSAPTTASNTPENDADASSADKGGALYPNVVKTLTQSQVGEGNPEGTLTVSEFAGYLTVEAIKAGGGAESIVDKANIYTAVKAVRHPLPVVLVFADDADQTDLKSAKVYIPVEEGTKAYANRPARGDGSASPATKRTADELLTVLAKKTVSLVAIKKRLDRATEQHNKAAKLAKKYNDLALENYKDATPVEITTKDEEGNDVTRLQTPAEAAQAALRAALELRIDELAKESEPEGTDIADNADNA